MGQRHKKARLARRDQALVVASVRARHEADEAWIRPLPPSSRPLYALQLVLHADRGALLAILEGGGR